MYAFVSASCLAYRYFYTFISVVGASHGNLPHDNQDASDQNTRTALLELYVLSGPWHLDYHVGGFPWEAPTPCLMKLSFQLLINLKLVLKLRLNCAACYTHIWPFLGNGSLVQTATLHIPKFSNFFSFTHWNAFVWEPHSLNLFLLSLSWGVRFFTLFCAALWILV
jgi:hypothetical protein